MADHDLIAYCGIRCSDCPVYVATVNNDRELAKKTAREWTESSGISHCLEDMHCLGCKSDDLFRWCQECGIRACADTKKHQTCGHCHGYKDCTTIGKLLNQSPKEKAYLDAIHHSATARQEHWSVRRS